MSFARSSLQAGYADFADVHLARLLPAFSSLENSLVNTRVGDP